MTGEVSYDFSYIVVLALEMVTIHLLASYHRYLPFGEFLSRAQKKKLFRNLMLLGAGELLLYVILVDVVVIDFIMFKRFMTVSWLPYFFMGMYVIRNRKLQHVYVGSMQMLYYGMIQVLSGITIYLCLFNENGYVATHVAALHIIYFCLFLPFSSKVFGKMLPPDDFLKHVSGIKKNWFFLAPFLVILAEIPQYLHDRTYTLEYLLTQLNLVVIFALMYTLVSTYTRMVVNTEKEKHNKRLMKEQILSLKDYAFLLNESNKRTAIIRHDFRHNVRVISSLLENDDVDAAKRMLTKMDGSIKRTEYRKYCQEPIINAAISVYMKKAKEQGIETEAIVDLSADMGETANEFAIVISNLLENALKASSKQSESNRAIKLNIKTKGKQIALSIANRFDYPLKLGEDGLPRTDEKGHGTGMISIKEFVNSTSANIMFTQKNGWVQVLVYLVFK